jgi:hypothetical protein
MNPCLFDCSPNLSLSFSARSMDSNFFSVFPVMPALPASGCSSLSPGPYSAAAPDECPGLVHPALAGAAPLVMAGQVATGALLCCLATTPNGPMTKGQTRRCRAACWPGHLELPGQGPFLPRGLQQQQSATPPRSAHVPKVEDEVITNLPLVNIISAV